MQVVLDNQFHPLCQFLSSWLLDVTGEPCVSFSSSSDPVVSSSSICPTISAFSKPLSVFLNLFGQFWFSLVLMTSLSFLRIFLTESHSLLLLGHCRWLLFDSQSLSHSSSSFFWSAVLLLESPDMLWEELVWNLLVACLEEGRNYGREYGKRRRDLLQARAPASVCFPHSWHLCSLSLLTCGYILSGSYVRPVSH